MANGEIMNTKIVNLDTQEILKELPDKVKYQDKIVLNPTFDICLALNYRYCREFQIPDGHKAVNVTWVQDTDDPRYAVAEYDLVNIEQKQQQKEADWQARKPDKLKHIENTYIDFLTGDWTMTLQHHEMIPQDYTITVDNTDEDTNVGLLLQLRAIDKTAYSYHSNEFLKFKTMIQGLGGIMSKVKQHNFQPAE